MDFSFPAEKDIHFIGGHLDGDYRSRTNDPPREIVEGDSVYKLVPMPGRSGWYVYLEENEEFCMFYCYAAAFGYPDLLFSSVKQTAERHNYPIPSMRDEPSMTDGASILEELLAISTM